MRPDPQTVLIVAIIVAFGLPVLIGVAGLFWRGEKGQAAGRTTYDWRLTAGSTLLHVLAFNLVFFVQEVFLVLPKALTPGLAPVLFHNNHDWSGDNPLAELFQGTGALATLVLGLAALAVLRARTGNMTPTARLFLFWLAFNGVFMALPQVVIGAIVPGNDVGRAMDYLGFSGPGFWIAVAAALAGMSLCGWALVRPMLELASSDGQLSSRWRRTEFILKAAVAPGLAGAAAILPYRIPGSVDQVALVPMIVVLTGVAWLAAMAWMERDARPRGGPVSLIWPLAACLGVLAIFQIVLRPGIAF